MMWGFPPPLKNNLCSKVIEKWAPWQTPERQTPERQTPERQTPEKTNSWRDKLLKIKTSEIQTPKYQILKKNVSQFIFNLAAALGPESVIT